MIMTIDVGNTNITVGVFRGDEVVSNFRITTKMPVHPMNTGCC